MADAAAAAVPGATVLESTDALPQQVIEMLPQFDLVEYLRLVAFLRPKFKAYSRSNHTRFKVSP